MLHNVKVPTMNIMDYKEFSNRLKEVAKARKIFIPHITNNISVAFELYQEVLADEKREVFISTAIGGNEPKTPMHDYERPRCPEDDKALYLKIMVPDKNGKIWNTAWYCKVCGSEFYSDKEAEDWIRELTKIV
jgi:hypothetical protein